jgi:hypothetical protein
MVFFFIEWLFSIRTNWLSGRHPRWIWGDEKYCLKTYNIGLDERYIKARGGVLLEQAC